MAITWVTYRAISALFKNGHLPKVTSILEFGEANWYGDVPVDQLITDIKTFSDSIDEREFLLNRVAAFANDPMSFDIPKIFFRLFFGAKQTDAIDLHGTDNCIHLDLNKPIDLGKQYDVTINNGTAEHVFNISQFFSTQHLCTRPGGLMVHEGPCISDWVDHGFVNLQPTLFFDMSAANGYEMVSFLIGTLDPFSLHGFSSREEILKFCQDAKLPKNPVFFVVLKKGLEEENFRFPMQGYYADTLSNTAKEAWTNMR